MNDIFSFLPTLIFMPLFAIVFILMSKKEQIANIYNVCIMAIVANMIIVLRFFYLLDLSSNEMQLITKFKWLEQLNINLIFGADVFSLFLILGIHLAFLIILSAIKDYPDRPKTMAMFSMLFLSMITGFLISADMFSFYLFFEAMLIPVFLLIGVGGELKKQQKLFYFFLYNIFASLLLFVAIIVLFNYKKDAYIISNVHKIGLSDAKSYFIWIAILLSFLSRLPIWPFHYMISSINASIKTPIAFLISNILPLTAIYGFIRLMPATMEETFETTYFIVDILAIVSMAFMALISFVHKDFQYKMFSHISIIYLFYLLATILTDINIGINISLSFFGFILAISCIEILWKKYTQNNIQPKNINHIFCFLVLVLIGAPFSSIFLNNFVILSNLYNYAPIYTAFIFAILVLSGASVLLEMTKIKTSDEKIKTPKFLIFVCFILLMSFIKPFWFVEL